MTLRLGLWGWGQPSLSAPSLWERVLEPASVIPEDLTEVQAVVPSRGCYCLVFGGVCFSRMVLKGERTLGKHCSLYSRS